MGKKKRKAQGASEVGNAGPDPAEGVDAPVASAEAEGIAEASSEPATPSPSESTTPPPAAAVAACAPSGAAML